MSCCFMFPILFISYKMKFMDRHYWTASEKENFCIQELAAIHNISQGNEPGKSENFYTFFYN